MTNQTPFKNLKDDVDFKASNGVPSDLNQLAVLSVFRLISSAVLACFQSVLFC